MIRKNRSKLALTVCLSTAMLFTASTALADAIPTVPTPANPVSLLKEVTGKVLGVEMEYSEETAELEQQAQDATEAELAEKLQQGVEVQVVMGVVNAEGLKVRALPKPESEMVGSFSYQDTLVIVAKDGKWYQVKYGDSFSWVYAPYIINLEDSTIIIDPEEETDYVTLDELNANDDNREIVVEAAKKCLGKPYSYGSTGPNSFDCSGLVTYVYKQVGVAVPRTSRSYYSVGNAVSVNEAQAGDIVCFSSRGGTITHVGIYVGEGQFIHAATGSIHKVNTNSIYEDYYSNRLVSIRRVL